MRARRSRDLNEHLRGRAENKSVENIDLKLSRAVLFGKNREDLERRELEGLRRLSVHFINR